MRSQQVLHLFQFAVAPPLSSWLGSYDSLSPRTPLKGFQ